MYYDPKLLTRSGVAYNLHVSPHKLEVNYGNSCLLYVFSSDFYKRKFEEKMLENRILTSEKLSKRYKFTINNDIISDLTLYDNWEKKGFLVKIKKEGFEEYHIRRKFELLRQFLAEILQHCIQFRIDSK